MQATGLLLTALRDVQVIVTSTVVVPGVALVIEGHVERGGAGWERDCGTPGAVAQFRHGSIRDAVPVVVAPVHGEAGGAGGQAAIVGDRHLLAVDQRTGRG